METAHEAGSDKRLKIGSFDFDIHGDSIPVNDGPEHAALLDAAITENYSVKPDFVNPSDKMALPGNVM